MPTFAFFHVPIEGEPSMHLVDALDFAAAKRRAVAAVKDGQLRSVHVWDGRRVGEVQCPTAAPPSPQADACDDRSTRMAAMRAEGRTYRAIGETYGVSVDRVKQIIARAEAQVRLRTTEPNRAALSVRAQNVLSMMIDQPEEDRAERDQLLPARVAALTRKQIADAFNAGKGTLAEIEAWLWERGLTLSDEP